MKKLILLFRDNCDNLTISETDIVMSIRRQDNVVNQIVVNPNELPLARYRDDLENVKSAYLSTLTDELTSKALQGSFNNFYNHIFRALFKWIDAIETVLQHEKISEVIITDIVEGCRYLPYYEAEGEINNKLFYKNYDFIPALVFDFLKRKNVKVKILSKHSPFNQKIRIGIRRYVLLIIKLFLSIRGLLIYKFSQAKFLNKVPIDSKFILLSRGVPHTQYFLPYLSYNDSAILHVSDGIKSGSRNHELVDRLRLRSISYFGELSFLDIISSWFRIVYSLMKTHKLKPTNIYGVKLPLDSAIKEMIIGYFEVELYELSLSRLLSNLDNQNPVIISGEMLTPYAFATGSAAKRANLKSIQLQTSLLDYWPQTQFVFCDKFVFTSFQAFQKYLSFNPQESHKFDFWGLLTQNRVLKKRDKLSRILYFSQPYENENECLIVDQLLKICSELGIDFRIKLHPRDEVNKFGEISSLLLQEPRKAIDEYIHDYDLVVVRTSAIGKEAVIYGIPTIVVLLSETDRSISVDFIQESYKRYGSFVDSIDGMNKAIMDFESTQQEFFKYRKIFFSDNRLYQDARVFTDNLLKFSSNGNRES